MTRDKRRVLARGIEWIEGKVALASQRPSPPNTLIERADRRVGGADRHMLAAQAFAATYLASSCHLRCLVDGDVYGIHGT